MKLSTLQNAAIRESLRNAFLKNNWFDLSAITDACIVLSRPIYEKTNDWAILKALHCKHWEHLSNDERRELMALCATMLGYEPDQNINEPILAKLPSYKGV